MALNIGFKHVSAFVAVARSESFSRAAESLNLSQPTLTTTIQHLEASLGLLLFDRTTRRVALTVEGERFLPIAEKLIGDFETAVVDLRETAKGKRGRVRIAALPGFAARVMPTVVKDFSARHPNVAVQLRDGNDLSIIRHVKSGDVDFGIGSTLFEDGELFCQELTRDPLGLVCRAADSLGRSYKPIRWQDIADQPFIGFSADTGIRKAIDTLENLPANAVSPLYEASSTITMEALLEAGLGVTAMFRLGAPRGRNRKLTFRPLIEPASERSIATIRLAERSLSPVAAAMHDCLIEHLAKRTDGFHLDHGDITS